MAAEGGVQLGPKTRTDRCYNSSSLFRTAKVMVGRKANCCPFISKSFKRSINAFCDITRMYENMCFTANFLKSEKLWKGRIDLTYFWRGSQTDQRHTLL